MNGTWRRNTAAIAFFIIFLGTSAAEDGSIFQKWNDLEKKIRDRSLAKKEAAAEVRRVYKILKEAVAVSDTKPTAFPVHNANCADIGGKNGNGYVPNGYDFYEGKAHIGHPSHDIFIHDRDFDGKDDRTGRQVAVLAFTSGVVVALETSWQPGDDTRGGKYVWIYDRLREAFFVYAHLQEVSVALGEPIRAGQKLGTVGRTGLNAYPRRSPTHLHITRLDFDDGRMSPRDIYAELCRARPIRK